MEKSSNEVLMPAGEYFVTNPEDVLPREVWDKIKQEHLSALESKDINVTLEGKRVVAFWIPQHARDIYGHRSYSHEHVLGIFNAKDFSPQGREILRYEQQFTCGSYTQSVRFGNLEIWNTDYVKVGEPITHEFHVELQGEDWDEYYEYLVNQLEIDQQSGTDWSCRENGDGTHELIVTSTNHSLLDNIYELESEIFS